MFFDMGYMMMVMLPGMVLSGAASWMVKRTFSKYETVGTASNMTGAEAAKLMLERAGVTDCRIEPIGGRLSDHYDPAGQNTASFRACIQCSVNFRDRCCLP